MRKEKLLLLLGTTIVVSLCGCQKSPESSIVTNKDFDNMIEQAENTEGGVTDVAEVAGNYDTYKATFSDESLGVTVNVDAKVDIPETNQMSIFRVTTKKFDQEFLDKVRETLSPGVTYYDGRATQTRLKGNLEQEIQTYKQIIADLEASGESPGYLEECRGYLNSLQEDYENAPDVRTVEGYPEVNELRNISELYNSDPDDDYYSWQYQFDTNSEIYYGISDAKDGNYMSLYVQNNENYGNGLSFRSSKQGYVFNSPVFLSAGEYCFIAWDPDNTGDKSGAEDINISQYTESTSETLTISEEQAKQTADELLNNLGITEFRCTDIELRCEVPDIRDELPEQEYRKVYVFYYDRFIDGVPVNNDGGAKHEEGWDGDDYVKKFWVGEKIAVLVNDNGIVGFDYMAPLEIIETVVDKSNLKSFEEVKDIFEQIVVVINAKQDYTVNMEFDRVALRYARISEADSYDTGLLVPVWDFIGTSNQNIGYFEDAYMNVLSINAIDGSIIDKELGY